MVPETDFASRLTQEETQRLASKVAECDKELVAKDGIKLMELQNVKEGKLAATYSCQDISVLPTLGIDDISKSGKNYPVDIVTVNDRNVSFRSTSTNGVSYLKVSFSMDHLPIELRPYLPLYTQVRLIKMTKFILGTFLSFHQKQLT